MVFSNGYAYRKLVTQDHTKVSGGSDLANFPVLISTTDARLRTVANGGAVQSSLGYDIRFETIGGTKLDHEIETWSATTGALIAWVRIPTLSASADTTFYIYYGNASVVASEQNATGVWDSSFVDVYHLADGTTLSGASSVASGHALTSTNATAATGQIDGAASFDGATAYMQGNPGSALDGQYLTIEAWIYRNGASGTSYPRILDRTYSTQFAFYIDESSGPRLAVALATTSSSVDTAGIGSVSLPSAVLTHVVCSYDGANIKTFVNGVLDATYAYASGALATSSGSWRLGQRVDDGNGARWYKGNTDEVRVSKIARAAGWIGTSYNSQSSPTTFLSFGPENAFITAGALVRGKFVGARVSTKPSIGSEFLDKSHPLAVGLTGAWLFNGPGFRNLVNNHAAVNNAPNSGFGTERDGVAFQFGLSYTDNIQLDSDAILPLAETTVFLAARKRDTTDRSTNAFGTDAGSLGSTNSFGVSLPWTNGNVSWDFGGAVDGTSRLTALSAPNPFGDNIWAFTSGPRGMEIWQNGVLIASQTSHVSRANAGNHFMLGQDVSHGSDYVSHRFMYVYNRQMSVAEIQAATTSPYTMFRQAAPLSRFASPTPTGNGALVRAKTTPRGANNAAGTAVNFASPLAQKLVAVSTPQGFIYPLQAPTAAFNANSFRLNADTRIGKAVVFDELATGGLDCPVVTDQSFPLTWVGLVGNHLMTDGIGACFAAIGWGGSGGWKIGTRTTTSDDLVFTIYTVVDDFFIGFFSGFQDQPVVVGISVDADAGTVSAYRNGTLFQSYAVGGSMTVGSFNYRLGCSMNVTDHSRPSQPIAVSYLWKRVLSAAEHATIAADPYALVSAPRTLSRFSAPVDVSLQPAPVTAGALVRSKVLPTAALPAPSALPDPTNPLSRGLVGAWLFNTGGDKYARDLSGYGAHGVLTGTTYTKSLARGLENTTDAVADGVYVTSKALDAISADVTAAVIIRPSATPGATMYPLIKWPAGGAYPFAILITTGGLVSWQITDGTNTCQAITTASYIDGKTHIVVGVRSGNTNYLYIDGVLVASATQALGSTANTATVGIGNDSGGSAHPIIGSMRGALVWNRALTASEVQTFTVSPYRMFAPRRLSRFASPTPTGNGALVRAKARGQWRAKPPIHSSRVDWSHPLASGLTGFWLLNEAGAIIHDATGYNADGTVANATRSADGLSAFTNASGIVTIPNGPDISSEAGTVASGFSQSTANAGSYSVLAEKWTTGVYPYVLRISSASGQAQFAAYDGGNNPTITAGPNLFDGKPHVAMGTRVYRGTMALYVDGAQVGTVADSTTASTVNSVPLYLGNRISDLSRELTGTLRFVARWNRVLSADEAKAFAADPYAMIGAPRTLSRFSAPVSNIPQFTNGYSYRKLISTDSTKVSGGSDLNNFPVLVSVTDVRFATVANGGAIQSATGYDIRFESLNGVKLDHEIESWNSTTGALIAWVRIPVLSASSTTNFYIYYGNSKVIASEENKTGVWDTNYLAVYHLNDNAATTAIADSTGGTSFTDSANTSTKSTTGTIGNGLNFARSSFDNATLARSLDYSATNQITISAWAKLTSPAPNAGGPDFGLSVIYDSRNATANDLHLLGFNGTAGGAAPVAQFTVNWDGSIASGNRFQLNGATGLSLSTWYYLVGTYDGTTGRVFVNGSQDAAIVQSGITVQTPNSETLGKLALGGANAYFDGTIDEVRVSKTARSSGWVATEYNVQSSPSTFLSFGSEEIYTSSASKPAGTALVTPAFAIYLRSIQFAVMRASNY